jgi:DNA topoisomerase-3
LQQSEEGKWRVEFDEEWAKGDGKPPEPAEAAADGAAAADDDAAAAA